MRSHIRRTVTAAALAGALAAGAGTSSAASSSGAAAASFCSVSKGVARQIATLGSSLSNTATLPQREATLKSQLTAIRRAAPALKSTAPRSLKPKALTVLGFINLAYTKLSAVDWNLAALGGQPQTVAALQSASTRAQPAIDALDGYYRKTCKFRI